MTGSTAETEIFEQHRRSLTGVAYRITGSWTDAEDIAQDVWLRWANAHSDVDKPRNWLLRVTVRASLDRLRRLKRRRETYLGPWLPEPVSLAPDPEDTAELRDTLMVGMLLVLESLSPLERAVFVLREAFAWITRTSPKRWAGHPLRFGNLLDEPTSTSNKPGRDLRWTSGVQPRAPNGSCERA